LSADDHETDDGVLFRVLALQCPSASTCILVSMFGRSASFSFRRSNLLHAVNRTSELGKITNRSRPGERLRQPA